uniref:phospholipid scramblase 1-like n=1 Tax=Styela clava TaxID=7725 RepID=UPI001939F07E|nr:phospholipid scramblase 1-like [Styela clava]
MAMPMSNMAGPPPGVLPPAAIGTSGLQYLAQMNEVRINQQVEIAEVMTGIDMANRYQVLDGGNRLSYFVYEESECCNRVFCKENRGFIMHMMDNTNQEVLRMERIFRCCTGCCWFKSCGHILDITANGVPLGLVRQSQYCLQPKLSIENSSGQELYHIEGPMCVCHGPCCFGDVPFNVFASGSSAEPVACISRVHAGCAQEMFSKANHFKIVYQQNLDLNSRALIFSATFLLDMMFFEHDK